MPDMGLERVLEILRRESQRLRRQYGVRSLAIFVSLARGEARPDSDVDVLVELERSSFDDFMGLKLDLESLLGSRVDLVTRSGLRPRLRPIIDREAVRVA